MPIWGQWWRWTAVVLCTGGVAGCGSTTTTHATTTAAPVPRPAKAAAPVDPKAAEIARERAAASYEPPPAATLAAAGPTPKARIERARIELLRAAADLRRYYRVHGTYAIGPVASLHRLDPRTELVDFVDGRPTSFFIAAEPPSTAGTWRYDYDHNIPSTACEPAGRNGCPPNRHW